MKKLITLLAIGIITIVLASVYLHVTTTGVFVYNQPEKNLFSEKSTLGPNENYVTSLLIQKDTQLLITVKIQPIPQPFEMVILKNNQTLLKNQFTKETITGFEAKTGDSHQFSITNLGTQEIELDFSVDSFQVFRQNKYLGMNLQQQILLGLILGLIGIILTLLGLILSFKKRAKRRLS